MINKLKDNWMMIIFMAGMVGGFVKYAEVPSLLEDLQTKVTMQEKEYKSKIAKLEKELYKKDNELEKLIKKNELKIDLNNKRIENELLNSGVEDIFKN